MQVKGIVELRVAHDHRITLDTAQMLPYRTIKTQLRSFAEEIAEKAANLIDRHGLEVSVIRIKIVTSELPTMGGPVTNYTFMVTVEGEPFESAEPVE